MSDFTELGLAAFGWKYGYSTRKVHDCVDCKGEIHGTSDSTRCRACAEAARAERMESVRRIAAGAEGVAAECQERVARMDAAEPLLPGPEVARIGRKLFGQMEGIEFVEADGTAFKEPLPLGATVEKPQERVARMAAGEPTDHNCAACGAVIPIHHCAQHAMIDGVEQVFCAGCPTMPRIGRQVVDGMEVTSFASPGTLYDGQLEERKDCAPRFLNMGLDRKEPPPDWWEYHHPACGTEYRGCHPTLCPKEQYEQTGVWRADLVMSDQTEAEADGQAQSIDMLIARLEEICAEDRIVVDRGLVQDVRQAIKEYREMTR